MRPTRPRAMRSLARPFVALVAVTCLVLAGLTVAVSMLYGREREHAARLTDHLVETIGLNHELRGLLRQHEKLARRAAFAATDEDQARLQRLHLKSGRRLNRYLALAEGLEERNAVETVRQLQSRLAEHVQFIVLVGADGSTKAGRPSLDSVTALQADIEKQLHALSSISSSRLRSALGAEPSMRAALALIVVAAACGLVSCGLFVWLLRRRVLLRLASISVATDRIALGDFSRPIDVSGDDELARLGERINLMSRRLADAQANLEQALAARTAEVEQAHEHLLQSEKMSAVGRLVSGVAHELNNPLTAIIGYAELARDDIGPGHESTRRLDAVLEQAERSRRIVADLLQFARQRETTLAPLDLVDAVRSGTSMWRSTARTAEIELTFFSEVETCIVHADRYKIQQVILALLNNAADAAAEADDRPRVEVRVSRRDGSVVVDVLDNGPGVACPERIFDPFYTTKPEGQGTGLGLTICYGIVHDHDGALEAFPRRPRGTCFRMVLPVGAQAAACAAGQDSRLLPEIPGNLRVLLVDDEPDVLEVERQFVERLGLICTAVSSATDAVRSLETGQFDLVVTDIRMPGPLNGLDLARWIRRHRSALSDRVLFVTGDLVGAGSDATRLPGPHLLKPFGFERFRAAIAQVLDAELTT